MVYRVYGLRFKDRQEFVKGVADMVLDYDRQINVANDGKKPMDLEEFKNEVYDELMMGCVDVISYMDDEVLSVEVPDDVRFLGEEQIKAIAEEFFLGE